MNKNQIDSYTFDLKYLPSTPKVALLDHEHRRIQRTTSNDYANSRYLLRYILKRYSSAPIFYHPSGKPDIKDPKITFSISHSRHIMTIAVMSCSSLGIDIQFDLPHNHTSLHKKYGYLPTDPDSFLHYWKTTEAYCKCTQKKLLSTLRDPIDQLITQHSLYIAHDTSPLNIIAVSNEPIIKINHCNFYSLK